MIVDQTLTSKQHAEALILRGNNQMKGNRGSLHGYLGPRETNVILYRYILLLITLYLYCALIRIISSFHLLGKSQKFITRGILEIIQFANISTMEVSLGIPPNDIVYVNISVNRLKMSIRNSHYFAENQSINTK